LSSANNGDAVVGSVANVSIAAPPSRPSEIAAALKSFLQDVFAARH